MRGKNWNLITLMDWSSGDLASRDLIYKILTRETSMVSITLFGSILRIKENTASLISASISCSLEAPALITAAKTCKTETGQLFISFFSLGIRTRCQDIIKKKKFATEIHHNQREIIVDDVHI